MSEQTFKRRGRRVARRFSFAPAALALIVLAAPAASCAAKLQSLEFETCEGRELPERVSGSAQCATLTVPEDHETPSGPTIALPVLKIPATDENPGPPVFVLNGGPGSPNLDTIRELARVEAQHDVYYVGYRGADGDKPLVCPEIAPRLSATAVLSKENLNRLADAGSACASRLSGAGVDLSDYDMFDVIADLEAARTAMGYEKIHLFSSSYGTRLAQYYARLHPPSIARSAMLGANPPGHFVFSAYANDKTLDRLSELCAADAFCSSQTDDLKRTILAALHAGARDKTGRIDDGKSRLALFFALYSREHTLLFIKAALAAEHGDLAPLEEVGKFAVAATGSTVWGEMFSKGFVDFRRYEGLAPTFETTERSMGSPLDMLFEAATRRWPKPPIPEAFHRAALDETETLILNGGIDVATPVMFVEAELMPYLPNGELIVLKDYGHNDKSRQNGAIDEIIARFYGMGVIDASPLKDDPYVFRK